MYFISRSNQENKANARPERVHVVPPSDYGLGLELPVFDDESQSEAIDQHEKIRADVKNKTQREMTPVAEKKKLIREGVGLLGRSAIPTPLLTTMSKGGCFRRLNTNRES